MAIDSILIEDNNSGTAPPERVLQVGVLDGEIFLTIHDHEETNKVKTLTVEATIAVPIADLISAVQLLDAAEKAANSKEPDGA